MIYLTHRICCLRDIKTTCSSQMSNQNFREVFLKKLQKRSIYLGYNCYKFWKIFEFKTVWNFLKMSQISYFFIVKIESFSTYLSQNIKKLFFLSFPRLAEERSYAYRLWLLRSSKNFGISTGGEFCLLV